MDCSKTINFLMAQKRLCSSQGYCQQRNKNDNCPLYAFCNRSPNNYSVAKVKEAIEAMQKWIDEHPGKTYAQDFLKSFRKPSRTHTVCRGCAAQIATAEAVVSPRRLIQIKKSVNAVGTNLWRS